MLTIGIAQTAEERDAVYRFRYSVYVEEMGRYQGTADHDGHRLSDAEDEWSWIAYARDGDEVVATTRLTWGGAGFSPRQIEQYGLDPFLAELPADLLAVGERTMVAPAWRGTDVFLQVSAEFEPMTTERGIRVVFGACEPHLVSFYGRWQRPYGTRNINSAESGYLIPLVCFLPDAEALVGLGDGDGLPRCVQDVVDGTGMVRTPLLSDPVEYGRDVRAALHDTPAPVFADLDDDEIDRCIAKSTVIQCAEGDRILRRGGSARNVFIVLSGALEVSDDDHPVAVLLPGDVFGEIAYLLRQPRSLDVDALTDDTTILSLSESTLRKLTTEDPALAAKLLGNVSKILCERLIRAG